MRHALVLIGSLVLASGLSACGGGGTPGSSAGAGSITVGAPNCEELPSFEATAMNPVEYQAAAEVWCLTNDARAQNNLPPLGWHDAASEIAFVHSVYQKNQGDISHTGPGGNNAGQRLTQGGVQWSTWGENVAVGQTSSTAVVNAWLRSSGHYANIMSGNVTNLGVGCAEGPGGIYNGPWWTQKFFAP